MPLTRREFVAKATVGVGALGSANEPDSRKAGMGIVLYSFGIRAREEKAKGFAEPLAFAAFCRERGAAGVQVPLGTRSDGEASKLRDQLAELGMSVEGIVRAPASARDTERFEAEIRAARTSGGEVVRTVLSPGRRYEAFDKAEDFRHFAARAEATLKLAEPIVRKHKIALAVENHKDYRVDELVAVMERFSSEFLGVCLDTGNNVALLDEPLATAKALARWTRTVHLKDMGLEESKHGFLLSEVPLGRGRLDLQAIVAAVRKANARARFNLEMITRDPLSIPCFTEKYWATLEKVPARDLARMIAWVRTTKNAQLPRISTVPVAKQLKAEEEYVRASFEFAVKEKLLTG